MRLLNVRTLEFDEFEQSDAPKYVVASHRWKRREEVSLEDVRNKRNTDKSGYKKIEGFAAYVRGHIQNVEWLWIDTCCVNQDSSQEVTEAINSMFRWFAGAELCIAYLADVSDAKNEEQFRNSEWHKRGWTLQELLAPNVVIFVSQDWQIIGYKNGLALADGASGSTKTGRTFYHAPLLESTIATITAIPLVVLFNHRLSELVDVEEKLAWIEGRKTTKEEDMSYSLLGIFDIAMPVIYGEGAARARRRLLEEISKTPAPTRSAYKSRTSQPHPYPSNNYSQPTPPSDKVLARQLQDDEQQRLSSSRIGLCRFQGREKLDAADGPWKQYDYDQRPIDSVSDKELAGHLQADEARHLYYPAFPPHTYRGEPSTTSETSEGTTSWIQQGAGHYENPWQNLRTDNGSRKLQSLPTSDKMSRFGTVSSNFFAESTSEMQSSCSHMQQDTKASRPEGPECWNTISNAISKTWPFIDIDATRAQLERTVHGTPTADRYNASAPPKVPPGWTAHWSLRDSEWYYVNGHTEQSQWQRPTQPAANTLTAAGQP